LGGDRHLLLDLGGGAIEGAEVGAEVGLLAIEGALEIPLPLEQRGGRHLPLVEGVQVFPGGLELGQGSLHSGLFLQGFLGVLPLLV
jgi:hypothetical protein